MGLQITIIDEKTKERIPYDYPHLSDDEMLVQEWRLDFMDGGEDLFTGEMYSIGGTPEDIGSYPLNLSGEPLEEYFEPDDDIFRITDPKWTSDGEYSFTDWVTDCMNKGEYDAVRGLLEGGILGGCDCCSGLIWNSNCREVLSKYMAEIEEILNEKLEEQLIVLPNNEIEFTRYPQIAFEVTVYDLVNAHFEI